jgi:molybdopterin biosynthesis enzyme
MGSDQQRITRLAPLQEVYARVDAIAQPVPAKKVLPWQSVGHVLARDLRAAGPVPARPLALRDGWAVASERVGDAGPYAPVLLEPAPAWVECGDPLPEGTDAVLPPDAVLEPESMTSTQGVGEVLAPAEPGENVLPAGMDADTETPLRKAGKRLRWTDLAALRAGGIDRAWTRVPTIRLVSVRADLPDEKDFVGEFLETAIQQEGARLGYGSWPRERDLAGLLSPDGCDAVIAIGGTGMGRRDATVTTLARIGRVEIHGMGIRPGETGALGTIEQRPVLVLPGRLDAALSAWLLVGRRLCARLTGRDGDEPAVPVRLARKITSTIGIAEAIPVGACEGGVEPLASGYFPLRSLTRAAGWVFVPPESEGFPQGASVDMRPLP